jgi:Holliday junction DNA helicase RuvA
VFNSLTGTVTFKDHERLFLSTGAVEWEIWTTGQSLGRLPAAGSEARVQTYLHHREDVLRLYGFATSGERETFLELIRVEGVGPKLALKILSGIPSESFVAAVENEDIPTLQSIPGLGQKTAQKIVLKLRGRLVTGAGDLSTSSSAEDIVEALTGMGFDRREARLAVEGALSATEKGSMPDPEYEREVLTKAMKLIGEKKA